MDLPRGDIRRDTSWFTVLISFKTLYNHSPSTYFQTLTILFLSSLIFVLMSCLKTVMNIKSNQHEMINYLCKILNIYKSKHSSLLALSDSRFRNLISSLIFLDVSMLVFRRIILCAIVSKH